MLIPEEVINRNRDLLRLITPLTTVLGKVSRYGIPLDETVLRYKSAKWKQEIVQHLENCYELVGEFNPDSHVQVKKILYNDLRLPKVKENRKPTVNNYALAYLNYQIKGDEKLETFFYNFRRAKLLRHRLSNFVDKFLLHDVCVCYKGFEDKAGTKVCRKCAKSAYGAVTGFNPYFTSIRDGIPYTHASFLQLAITGRLNSLVPNIQQFSRDSKTWNITVRDIVKAPEGYIFVVRDLAKAERLIAAILFNDHKLLDEVKLGPRAFSSMAAEVFSVPEEQCSKGTDLYTGMKTAAYADQYGVHSSRLQKTLLKYDVYIPIETIDRMLNTLGKRYAVYKEAVKQVTWVAINRGWARNYQGRLFRIAKPVELEGIRSYKEVYEYRHRNNARDIFENCMRLVSSFIIQGSATGDNLQLMFLKTADALDRFTKPDFWSPYRPLNGDWTKARIAWSKHDELAVLCREEYADDVDAILKKSMEDFCNLEPYLENNSSGFEINLDSEPEKMIWWDVPLGQKPEAYL